MSVPPWLIFALIISLTLALLYQLGSRRFGWRVLVYWLLTFAAIAGAEAFSESVGWNVSRFGDLRLLPDLVAAGLMVAILWILGI